MSNSFQQSFMHLVAANNALNGIPRLQPAPTAPPTGLTPTSPPSLHLPTLPLSVLQPAPGAPSPPTPPPPTPPSLAHPPLAPPPLAPPAPASTTTLFEFIDSVAFLPVTDVIPAFESLAITFLNDELPLLSYFETTWIGQPAGGRRLAPTFPHQMWNVSDRASTRTTYSLEAFHHTFNALVSCQHRVEATPSTGEAAELHRRHPHPNTTRGFLPCEC